MQGLACYWQDLEELEVLLEDQGLGLGLGLVNAQGLELGSGFEDQGLGLELGLSYDEGTQARDPGLGPGHGEGTRASGSSSSTHTRRFTPMKPSAVQGMMKAFLDHCSQQQFAQTQAQAEALTQVQAQVQQAQPQMGAQPTPPPPPQPQSPTHSHIPVQTPDPDSLLSRPSPGCRAVDVKGAREMPSIDAYTFSLLRFASKHR